MGFNYNSRYKKSFIKILIDWILTILVAVIISLFIISNLVSITQVKEQSMEPTFKEDDRIIIYKLGYLFGEPAREDIVILNKINKEKGLVTNMINESKDIIDNIKYRFTNKIEKNNLLKRVIGVYGDIIDIQNGYIYVNGKLLEEKYSNGLTYASPNLSYPVEVPKDNVFVLGDNREYSLDSRDLGFISIDQIKGKAIFRILPTSRFGKVN